jgi:hypothetical protein
MMSQIGRAQLSSKLLARLTVLAIIFFILFIVGLVIWLSVKPKPSKSVLERVEEISKEIDDAHSKRTGGMLAKESLYSNLIMSLDPTERYLVNLCPLTASVGGFLGPLSQGVFEPNYFIRTCLKSGIRSFVLPISTYVDNNKSPPDWPYSTQPAIVYRGAGNQITSINGLSVKDFCKALVINKSENTAQAEEPILLYLHADEANLPDASKDEKNYVKFMSDLAAELDPINPYLLKSYKTLGSMVNARREREILLDVPLTDLKNKVLVFTNFDFKKFDNKAYTSYTKKLGDYVNFYYTPVVSENAGLTAGSGARSMRLEDVSGSKIDWKNQARNIWHASLLSSSSALSDVGVVNNAMRTGIQVIPCPWIFQDTDPKSFDLWQLWKGYAFRLKDASARYSKPVPVEPQQPSAKLNARVDNKLQPGQTKIT